MPGFRPTHVQIHPDVEPVYLEFERAALNGRTPEVAIWKSFMRAVERVRLDGQWGDVIPHIPAYFGKQYGARNLYCVDLAAFHRAFYTIEGRGVVFLDLVDHPTYDRLFGRRGRR